MQGRPDATRTPDPLADEPVFDRAQEDLPLADDEPLNLDEDGNVLPGNDPLDEDPNDNGETEQNDPEDLRRRRLIGQPLKE
ncbi:hypothetical protein EG244_15235 [Falsigemmobacter faecalis]|uniref:Uncharacterized protein n=1 Tax=Falsigemmobacter faecalis TaxID=2488730 RepID=A0A3P3DDJ0_9RHOB|nr:hypothetical protein EG244_15235 [Falsigemmobacter faecalis]